MHGSRLFSSVGWGIGRKGSSLDRSLLKVYRSIGPISRYLAFSSNRARHFGFSLGRVGGHGARKSRRADVGLGGQAHPSPSPITSRPPPSLSFSARSAPVSSRPPRPVVSSALSHVARAGFLSRRFPAPVVSLSFSPRFAFLLPRPQPPRGCSSRRPRLQATFGGRPAIAGVKGRVREMALRSWHSGSSARLAWREGTRARSFPPLTLVSERIVPWSLRVKHSRSKAARAPLDGHFPRASERNVFLGCGGSWLRQRARAERGQNEELISTATLFDGLYTPQKRKRRMNGEHPKNASPGPPTVDSEYRCDMPLLLAVCTSKICGLHESHSEPLIRDSALVCQSASPKPHQICLFHSGASPLVVTFPRIFCWLLCGYSCE
jgi:hypothetical protein